MNIIFILKINNPKKLNTLKAYDKQINIHDFLVGLPDPTTE